MASKKSSAAPGLAPAPPPGPYDAEATYQVRLTRPVKAGSFKYLPRDAPQMKGSLLNRIVEEHGADAVGTAERL